MVNLTSKELTMWTDLIERNQATDELVEIQIHWLLYKTFEKWKQNNELNQDEVVSVINYLYDALKSTPQFYRLSEIKKIYGHEPPHKLLKNLKPLVESAFDDISYGILQKLKIRIQRLNINLLVEARDRSQFETIANEFREKAGKFVRAYKENLANKLQTLYAQEVTSEGRNRIFRMMIESQNQLIESWRESLPLNEQYIDVRRLMLSDLSLAGLDLQRVRFENNQSNQVDLREISCNPEQFITVFGLAQQKIDEKLLEQILSAKVKHLTEKLTTAIELLEHSALMVNALEEFGHLRCRGDLPLLDNMSDVMLRTVASLALQSFYINTLNDKHPASHAKIASEATKLENVALDEIKNMLIALLEHRKRILLEDIIAFTQQQKIVLVFESISYLGDLISELTIIHDDLPLNYDTEASNLLQRVTMQYRELKAKKNPLIAKYQQELINNLLFCLNEPPDEQLSMTPGLRLEAAMNTAKGRPHLSIDLRAFDITTLPIPKDMQIDDVCLLINPAQEPSLPFSWQRQRYAPVLAAIIAGDVEKLSLILKNNRTLDINHQDEAGRTPLMTACVENQPAVVRFLLANGADCHILTKNGWNIFEGVARLGLQEVAMILLEYGAPPDFWSLIHLGKKEHEIESLLTPGCVNEPDYDGQMPLHIAIKHRHFHLIPWLHQQGADIEALNPRKQTPLHLAVTVDAELARVVIRLGGKITTQIVRAACENKHESLAREMRASVDQIDLYTAIYLNEIHTVHSIINNNANLIQADGFSALAIACSLGKCDLVKWLIEEKGADVNLVCKFETAGLHAINNNQLEVISLLMKLGVSLDKSIKGTPPLLFYAVKMGKTEIVRLMLQSSRGKKPDHIDVNVMYLERTSLLVAAHEGHTEIVQLLLEAGADPLLKDNEGNMALHLAANRGRSMITLILTQAILGLPNKRGKTPADLAGEQQQSRIVKLLTPLTQCEQQIAESGGAQRSPDINAGIHRMFSHKSSKKNPNQLSATQQVVTNDAEKKLDFM